MLDSTQKDAMKIIKDFKKAGYTLEQIARLLDVQGEGPSLWSVQRWLSGKNAISLPYAQRIIEIAKQH